MIANTEISHLNECTRVLLKYNLPYDIRKKIAQDVSPLSKRAIKIQRLWRKALCLKRHGYQCYECEDCHHRFWSDECVDRLYVCASVDGDTRKIVCPWKCVYHCEQCDHPVPNTSYDAYDPYDEHIQCEYCNHIFTPPKTWYGISNREYDMRMGDF